MIGTIDDREPELWFAVRVKSNREKVVVNSLAGKGYETFFPIYAVNQSARPAERPLFPGYVFSRFRVNKRLPTALRGGEKIAAKVGFRTRYFSNPTLVKMRGEGICKVRYSSAFLPFGSSKTLTLPRPIGEADSSTHLMLRRHGVFGWP